MVCAPALVLFFSLLQDASVKIIVFTDIGNYGKTKGHKIPLDDPIFTFLCLTFHLHGGLVHIMRPLLVLHWTEESLRVITHIYYT